LSDLDRALELAPRYAEALANRSAARRARGDLDGAIADLDRALAIRPDDAEFLNARADARQARGDLEGALADYDRLLGLLTERLAPPVYHRRGGVQFLRHDFAAAVADFSRAIALDPRFCLAYISRGNTRYHLRDSGGAEDYRVAFRLDPELAAWDIIRFLRADLREDVDAVLENCRKHLRIRPDDVVAYARRGLTLLMMGREAEAAADFEQVALRGADAEWQRYLRALIAAAR
jgi:tetratricopeptide (TPR) repeat protein